MFDGGLLVSDRLRRKGSDRPPALLTESRSLPLLPPVPVLDNDEVPATGLHLVTSWPLYAMLNWRNQMENRWMFMKFFAFIPEIYDVEVDVNCRWRDQIKSSKLVQLRRTFIHQKLVLTFPWIDNCLMVTFSKMKASQRLNRRSQNGSVA